MSRAHTHTCSRSRLALSALSALTLTLGSLSLHTLSPQRAEATVAYRATLKSLTEQADFVALVKVTSQQSPKERGPQGQIYTQSRVEVREYLKGQGEGELTVQQLGGTLDGLTMYVSGSPQLKVGAEYVLFLVKGEGSLTHIVSLAQGVYELTGPEGSALRQDLRGLTFYEPTPPQGPAEHKAHLTHTHTPAQTLTLSALKAQVSAHLTPTGGER